MATTFGGYTGTVSPRMYWYASYDYLRISNSYVRVTLTVVGEIKNHASTSWMGTGNNIVITGTAGGISQTYEIKSSSSSWYGNTNNPRSYTFTIDVPSSSAGASIGVSYSVAGTNYTAAAKVPTQSTSFSSPALLYTACGAPSGIYTSSTAPKIGETITISWSNGTAGTNNSIVGYELQEKINNGSWSTISTSNVTSKSIYISNTYGTTYRYRVRTLGSAGSSYYSGYREQSFNITVDNSPPSVWGLTSNNTKIPVNGATVRFSWSGSDPDKTSPLYYWYLEYSDGTRINSGSTTNNYVDVSVGAKGSKVFKVYAWDGMNGSSMPSISLSYNTAPSAPTITTSSGGYKTSTTINWNAVSDSNGDGITYYIYRSLGGNNTTFLTTTTNTYYTDSFISGSYAGQNIYYYVRAYDGIDYSGYSNAYYFTRNIPPSAPRDIAVSSYGTTVSGLPKIAEDKTRITWSAPSTHSSSISYYYIEEQHGSSSSSLGGWNRIATVSGGTLSYVHTITNFTRGNYINYRVRCSDSLGEYSSYITNSGPIKRNVIPSLSSLVPSASGTINVWNEDGSDKSINITWNQMITDDMVGKYRLLYYAPGYGTFDLIGNKKVNSISDASQISDSGNSTTSISIYLTKNEQYSSFISELFGAAANGVATGGYFQLIAYDGFGIASNTKTAYLNIDTRYTPTLNSDKSNYIIKIVSLDNNIATNSGSGTSTLYSMVNSGEQILLCFPPAKDYNNTDNSSMKYIIKGIESTNENYFTNTTGNNHIPLVTVGVNQLNTDELGNYYYIYTVPTVNQNEIMNFSIQAQDSTGLTSNQIVFPNGIEVCRSTEPSFVLNTCDWNFTDGAITGFKVNSLLLDNGGSLINSSRNLSYSDRRNLERYTENKKFTLELEYSNDSKFEEVNSLILIDLGVEELYYYGENSWEENIIFNFDIEDLSTKFIRLKLTINDAKSSNTLTRVVYSNFLILYASSPLLSGRENGLGISNSKPKGRLHVSPAKSSGEVVIFGNENPNIELYNRFIIDLHNGMLLAGIIDPGDLDISKT